MTLARRLRIWRQRILALSRTRALDAELERELSFHFDQLVAEKIAAGLPPGEARRAARLEFGNPRVVAEASRDQWQVAWIHDLGRDLAFGLRMLRKSPVFTAVAIGSLALGIGANAAVLAALDTALLRGLPLPHADRLVFIHTVLPDRAGEPAGVPVTEFLAWRDGGRAFDGLAATLSGQESIGSDRYGPAEQVRGLSVTPQLFAILGTQPLLGRVFDAAESRFLDPAPAIVISERLWRRRFASDPEVAGTAIRLNGVTRTIVGVMPASFRFQAVAVDYWIPLRLLPEPAGGTSRVLRVIARLKPGVSLAAAQSDLDRIKADIAPRVPEAQRAWRPEVQPLETALYGWARRPLLTLQIAVAIVLLIACANVAGLLLARAVARQREISLRMALGAGRRRILRQLLAESLLLSLAGWGLSLAVAWVGLHGLSAMTPALSSPALGPMALDLRVVGIALGLAVLSAAAFGAVPALTASRMDHGAIVRASGAERTTAAPHASHAITVSVQVAFAVMLLIGAGLLVKSAHRLAARDLHFDPDGVLVFDLSLPVRQRPLGTYHGSPYFEIVQPAAPTYARVLERLRGLPGVQSAGASSYPLVNSLILPSASVIVSPSNQEAAPPIDGVTCFLATPGFFATMRAPVRGRELDDRDTDAAPWVAVINESAARRFWPGQEAIGKRFVLDTVPEERVREVVGVIPDIPLRHGEVGGRPVVYASYLQQPAQVRAPWRSLFGNMTFAVRPAGDPLALLPAIRRIVADIDPDRAVAMAGTARQHLDAAMQQFRFFVFLIGALAGTAGVLAVMGIYGTVAYTAEQRVREIGVRKALGASRSQVMFLVARRALVTIGAGTATGLAVSLALNGLLSSQLWGIAPTDPATYAIVTLTVVAVSALACALPARRALAIDPVAALRTD